MGRGGGGNVAEILRERPNPLVGRFSGGRNGWNSLGKWENTFLRSRKGTLNKERAGPSG